MEALIALATFITVTLAAYGLFYRQPEGDPMDARLGGLRYVRPGKQEVPDPDAARAADFEAAVDDCLARGALAVAALAARPGPAVVVTNEVGSGIVPAGALSRYYRDALGLTNQAFAAAAERAFVLISGLPLQLK